MNRFSIFWIWPWDFADVSIFWDGIFRMVFDLGIPGIWPWEGFLVFGAISWFEAKRASVWSTFGGIHASFGSHLEHFLWMMSEVREGGLDRGLKRYYFILVCRCVEIREIIMPTNKKREMALLLVLIKKITYSNSPEERVYNLVAREAHVHHVNRAWS